ncbi:MAG: hypothetical protein QGF59_01645 [Pirellulaceae bacterium]|jgi:hypothetical protein|nr:hypothetical protein [Pirellulaceae bacterium]MDP6717321.1 hypothetical protein [Pirellulaceae bacterium]
MSSASTAQATTRLRVPETVRIVQWPLRDEGPQVWLAGLGIAGVGVAAGVVSGNSIMGAVCFTTLMSSCWRLWFPVTFELGTKGIIQSALVFRWRTPWQCFPRYETRHRGVWLLSDTEPSPLSTLRGIYVPWSDQQDQVLAVLDFFLAARRQHGATSTRTYAS